jgi:hypothetical protein
MIGANAQLARHLVTRELRSAANAMVLAGSFSAEATWQVTGNSYPIIIFPGAIAHDSTPRFFFTHFTRFARVSLQRNTDKGRT